MVILDPLDGVVRWPESIWEIPARRRIAVNRSSLLVLVSAMATSAVSRPVAAVTLYSDTFTAPNGTLLSGRVPEVNNGNPTASYVTHGSFVKDIQGNRAQIGADTAVSLTLTGTNIHPAWPLRISASLDIGTIAGSTSASNTGLQRGIGVGFFTNTGSNATSSGWRGVQIGTDGRLIVSQEGVASSSRAGFIAGIATGINLAVSHTVSYDINQFTGDISNILLDGILQSDITTNIFTDAAVQRAGLMVSSNTGGTVGFADNFVVEALGVVSIPGLFNTGVNNSGVALAGGAADPHYTLTVNPNGANGIPAVVETGIPGAWFANSASSQWVGPVQVTNDITTGGVFEYTTTFDLAGLDPTTALVQGRWASDNSGGEILINGISVGQANSGFGSLTSFQVINGFLPGLNSLTFRFSNGSASGDFTGLRVDSLQGFAIPLSVPEPATATLGLLALGGLMMRRRRMA